MSPNRRETISLLAGVAPAALSVGGQDRDDLSVLGAELLRDAALPRRKRGTRQIYCGQST